MRGRRPTAAARELPGRRRAGAVRAARGRRDHRRHRPVRPHGRRPRLGFGRSDVLETTRTLARDLRARGAELVVLLSHLGYEHEFPPWDDRGIAPHLQDDVDLIVGAHSHHLLEHAAGRRHARALWEASDSPANPGVTRMTGAQLLDLIARGNDPAFQAESPRPLRGRTRGRLVVAGGPVDPGRTYTVAATDRELGTYGGCSLPEWSLEIRYDFPTIVREAIEEHLRARR